MRAALPLAVLIGLSLGAHACGPARRPSVDLDLRGDVTSEVAAQAVLYREAGLPLIPGPVTVDLIPHDPQESGAGSRTYLAGGQLVVQLDHPEALAHELTHAWAWRVLGEPDGDHLTVYWLSPLLWPPGSRRPSWVSALIGPGL